MRLHLAASMIWKNIILRELGKLTLQILDEMYKLHMIKSCKEGREKGQYDMYRVSRVHSI